MRLATETKITIGNTSIVLRPTLRAALRLERKHGFDKLLSGVAEAHLGIIGEIIEETAEDRIGDLPGLLDQMQVIGLAKVVVLIQPALVDLVLDLAGVDPDDSVTATKPDPKVKPKAHGEHLIDLFKLGSGALGWTPDATWRATPAEILAAYEGRVALLRQLFGGSEPTKKPADDRPLAEKAKALFAGRGTTIVRRTKTP